MSKKRGGRSGMTGTEQAAIAARQAGLLDAYTESASTAISDSDKFKEGYKKKGKGKVKERGGRVSESEDQPLQPLQANLPPEPEEPAEVEDSWEDGVVESWEDIEAPEMPVPPKVKQEMRKQEKQRKKQEQEKLRGGGGGGAGGAGSSPGAPTKRDCDGDSSNTVEEATVGIGELKIDTGAAAQSTQQEGGKKDPIGKNSKVEGKSKASSDGGKLDSCPEDPAAVKAEREAKKAAKAAAKAAAQQKKAGGGASLAPPVSAVPDAAAPSASPTAASTAASTAAPTAASTTTSTAASTAAEEKARRKAEFEAKRLAAEEQGVEEGGGKSKAELKAERRAKQEAQRAAKTQALEQKAKAKPRIQIPDEIQADQKKAEKKLARSLESHNVPARTRALRQIPLFSHLHQYEKDNAVSRDLPVVGGSIHPAIVELGLQFIEGSVTDSEERCSKFLSALKCVVIDCLPGAKEAEDPFKEIDNVLKPNILFMKQCRPLSISMGNAVRAFKAKLKTVVRCESLEDMTAGVEEAIDDYINENITLAAKQISLTGANKILEGDVVLTYSSSGLLESLLLEAAKSKKFKLIVCDGRVQLGGKRLAARLSKAGVDTTYILLTAISQILPQVTKVIVGCESVMANGCVLGQVGTSQVALLAQSVGIPVLVCCQTYKFTERVQTDSFVYNELSDPDDLVKTDNNSQQYLSDWRDQSSLCLLNLVYDVTPASLVSAVITELSVIPTTSVPVILRLKNCEGHVTA